MGNLFDEVVEPKKGNLFDEVKPESPAVNPAPQQVQRIPLANAGPYTSGDEFQSLLQQAKQVGVDNLPEPQKSQVKAAIQGGVVREADLMGTQADPKAQESLAALGELAQKTVQSGDPQHVQEVIPSFLDGIDAAMKSGLTMPGSEAAGQGLQRFTEAFQLMPDTIPRDNSLAEVGRATKNLIKGAIRLAPEMLTAVQQNPYEFVKGFATFPIDEVNLLLQASIGWKVEDGHPIEVTADQVRKARNEVVNNPLGPIMLAMMAVGGAKGMKPGEYATVDLKAYQKTVEEAKVGEVKVQETTANLAKAQEEIVAHKETIAKTEQQLKDTEAMIETKPVPKPKKFDVVNKDLIPEDLEIDVEGVRAKTGEKATTKMKARQAFEEIDSAFERHKQLLKCLRS